jgi:glycyl-tRNA synthetase
MVNDNATFEKVLSLCKRRGFFYPSSDIYGGLNGVWDKGPLGTLLSRNIEQYWINYMKINCEYPLLLMDGAILGSYDMWRASGHVEGFHDPLVDCLSCNVRLRADEINLDRPCTRCGSKKWSDIRIFNMMFSTHIGPMEGSNTLCYLRPETAQTIFVQFKNIMATNRVKIPFGVMQIGKAFRNEITPKQFLFRSREFSQMEMEFFCHPDQAWFFFNFWVEFRFKFFLSLGLTRNEVRITPHEKKNLSHYSKATSDIEFLYPFGWKEIEGIAYRSDFDLKSHSEYSKKNLGVRDEEKDFSYIPHVVETSVGVERLLLVLLCHAYKEEEDINTGEKRIFLSFPFAIAPCQIAVFPLTPEEIDLAKKIFQRLQKYFRVCYDDNGSIGKRYRRQDEVGTFYCLTVDKSSLLTHTITVRHRDTKEQETVFIKDVVEHFEKII